MATKKTTPSKVLVGGQTISVPASTIGARKAPSKATPESILKDIDALNKQIKTASTEVKGKAEQVNAATGVAMNAIQGFAAATGSAMPTPPQTNVAVGGTIINPNTGQVVSAPAPTQTISADRRDAFAILQDTFAAYGIEGFSKIIEGYMKSDMGPYEASLKLKNEQAYKDRFKGNELRRAKGLNVLSEAEYLSQENTYQQIFASYNQTGIMGKTTEEKRNYMADLMARNIEPTQVKDRMDAAVAGIKNADPYAKAQLKAVYNLTEDQMVGFVLAPEQTLADINLKLSAAAVAGAATQYGFGAGAPTAAQMAQINALPEPERSKALEGLQRGYAQELQTKAEGMVKAGVSTEQAREGYSTIAGGLKQGQTIAARYGGQYDLTTAESEVFQRNQEAGRKRNRFASLERAAFTGQSGVTSGGRGTAGQI